MTNPSGIESGKSPGPLGQTGKDQSGVAATTIQEGQPTSRNPGRPALRPNAPKRTIIDLSVARADAVTPQRAAGFSPRGALIAF